MRRAGAGGLHAALTDTGAPRNKPAPTRSIPLEPELAVDFSPTELDSYRAQLHKDHPATIARRLVLLYAGGGLLPERAWPAAHYARVAQGLCAAGYAVGLIGLKDDAELARTLRKHGTCQHDAAHLRQQNDHDVAGLRRQCRSTGLGQPYPH